MQIFYTIFLFLELNFLNLNYHWTGSCLSLEFFLFLRFLEKLIRGSNNLGLDLFTDRVGHFGALGAHLEFCRQWGVPSGAALLAMSDCPCCC